MRLCEVMSKKILFVWHSRNDIFTYIPVIKKLLENGHEVCVAVNDTEKIDIEELTNLPTTIKKMSEYATSDIRKILRSENAGLVVVGNAHTALCKAFILSAHTLNLPTVFINYGITWAPKTKGRYLGDVLLTLTHEHLRPTLKMLLHSKVMPEYIKEVVLNARSGGYRSAYGVCTKTCVIGRDAYNLAVKNGICGERMVITGQPMFDTIVEEKSIRDEEDIKARLGLAGKKSVLFLTQALVEDGIWSLEEWERFMKAVLNALTPADINLIIKPHPREERERYLASLKNFRFILVQREEKLHKLLKIADVVISVHSAAVLEAMLMERPVVLMNFFGNPHRGTPFEGRRELCIAESPEELASAVMDVLSSPEVQRGVVEAQKGFVEDHAHNLDGRATERVVGVIESLLN